MRKICSSVLLLSDNEDFIATYKDIALECEVELQVENDFSDLYRVNAEKIICGSKYLGKVNPAYYEKVTVILKGNESFFEYLKMGINDFIFDYKDRKALAFAFTKQKKELVRANASVRGVFDLLENAPASEFVIGDYAFYFNKNRFFYRGDGIYLLRCWQLYLIEWLLKGNKDKNKRPYLCNMRKAFGSGFLKDIDSEGNLIRQ